MKNNTPDVKQTSKSLIIPVAGVIIGAAVMATVTNHNNQEKVQVLLEKVKNKASSFMKSAQQESQEGQEEITEKIEDVKETMKDARTDVEKKVAGIIKKIN